MMSGNRFPILGLYICHSVYSPVNFIWVFGVGRFYGPATQRGYLVATNVLVCINIRNTVCLVEDSAENLPRIQSGIVSDFECFLAWKVLMYMYLDTDAKLILICVWLSTNVPAK